MADKLVTIAQFTDYIQVEMAKQLFTDYGIEAVATGGNASNNMDSIPAVEGPELPVLKSQAEQAKEFLEAHDRPEQ
jgi:hypothetical protein